MYSIDAPHRMNVVLSETVKFATDSQVPLRIHSNDFGDPLAFNVVSSSAQHFHLFNTLWPNGNL